MGRNGQGPMAARERYDRIRQLVDADHFVKVVELSQLFAVSEETIRRDLLRLEEEGIARRIHGGAVLVTGRGGEPSLQGRETRNREQKRQIAMIASQIIQPGDTVVMDPSSTVLELARLLPDLMPITVLTNSVAVMLEFAKKQITVTCTGGLLRPEILSLVGPVAERSLTGYHVDKAFVSCRGLDVIEGATDASDMEVELKRRMLRAASQVILVVDSSKIGKVAFCTICELREIHTVVTDSGAPVEVLREMTAAGVDVRVAGGDR